jgi:hypothetical protein
VSAAAAGRGSRFSSPNLMRSACRLRHCAIWVQNTVNEMCKTVPLDLSDRAVLL